MTDEVYDAHLLILGGSFLGIELVRLLRRDRHGRALEIIVVDRQVEHPYIPLGHELLTERLPADAIGETVLASERYVTRAQGKQPRARWVQGEITRFDPETHTVHLADGRQLSGRFVVVALGSEVRPPPSLPGGERLLAAKFEAQLRHAHAQLDALLRTGPEGEAPTILVVGGGITGVEIAGELAHLAVARPPGWRAPKVVLVHTGERLLPGLTPRAGIAAARALAAQGVELRLGARLGAVEEHEAVITRVDSPGDPQRIPCALGFWAAGLQPPPVLERLGLPRTDDGWLRVGPTLLCFSADREEPEIFAGGDAARVYGGDGRWPTMQRAIEAIFAAETIAANILELARHPPGYPSKGPEQGLNPGGVPPLRPHRLWRDFPHGVSLGGRSLVVYGRVVVGWARVNIWFRRFLMRMYMRRYRPGPPRPA
jgi:NADH:ubiquinone reductase (H+-translocating)